MESHKTAMEENEQNECFGMENIFLGGTSSWNLCVLNEEQFLEFQPWCVE